MEHFFLEDWSWRSGSTEHCVSFVRCTKIFFCAMVCYTTRFLNATCKIRARMLQVFDSKTVTSWRNEMLRWKAPLLKVRNISYGGECFPGLAYMLPKLILRVDLSRKIQEHSARRVLWAALETAHRVTNLWTGDFMTVNKELNKMITFQQPL